MSLEKELTHPRGGGGLARQRCRWAIGYAYTPDTMLLHFLGCKRRLCEDCGYYWAWKWRTLLGHKIKRDLEKTGLKISRAISLTTSYDAGYKKVWLALKRFWAHIRKEYPKVQYWGVTEYNQKHTQPHFHFILSEDTYIPHATIQYYWEKAQSQALFEHIAWNVRIEEIKGDIQKYFTKYVTKLTNGKDEIPRPENWQGRYVRYSRRFFENGVSTKDILAVLRLVWLKEKEPFNRTYFDIMPKWGVDNIYWQGKFIEKSIDLENRQKLLDDKEMSLIDKNLALLDIMKT